MNEKKTLSEHLNSGVKYAGSSAIISYSIIEVILFFYPELDPIGNALSVLMMFLTNMLLIFLAKHGYSRE